MGGVGLSLGLLKVRVSEREAEAALDKILVRGLLAQIVGLATPLAHNSMVSRQPMMPAMREQRKYDGTKCT